MASLSYAVDPLLKRLRIYFNMDNPVEKGLLQMILVSIKPFAHQIPGSNLTCVEIGLQENTLALYKQFEEMAQAQAAKRPARAKKKKKTK